MKPPCWRCGAAGSSPQEAGHNGAFRYLRVLGPSTKEHKVVLCSRASDSLVPLTGPNSRMSWADPGLPMLPPPLSKGGKRCERGRALSNNTTSCALLYTTV